MRQRILLKTNFWLAILAIAALVSACAGNIVDHSFAFDMREDNQDAQVLDYRYGESKLPVFANRERVAAGEVFGFEGVTGPMLRGDFLYVKWRNKESGKIYEDTVDLRKRLPADIAEHKIYFMIRGSQLYVYLIPPRENKRPKEKPPVGPSTYDYRDTVEIYPGSVNK